MGYEYYYYQAVAWIGKHSIELFLFACGVSLWAIYDHFIDRVPRDQGFWSRKTGHDKWDITHVSKRVALACFAIAALGFTDIYYLLWNVYTWAILIAWLFQKIIYNWILKWLHKWTN